MRWSRLSEDEQEQAEDGLKRIIEAWLAKDPALETRLAIAEGMAKDRYMLPWRWERRSCSPWGGTKSCFDVHGSVRAACTPAGAAVLRRNE